MLARLRKGILVYLLVLVAASAWWTQRRVASWENTLWVVIHPINGDGSEASRRYIAALERDAFDELEAFLNAEARRHGVSFRRPVDIPLGETVTAQPPAPPRDGNVLAVVWWSLQMRWWSWWVDRGDDPPHANGTVYVRYFDPLTSPTLAHSLGLQKGMIGVVNAFATRHQRGSNQVIIAHELMHMLGAGDRYDPLTNQPRWPEGFAEPHADPLYPQRFAEIMGGRVPVAADRSETPGSLAEVTVGARTAAEVGWADAD